MLILFLLVGLVMSANEFELEARYTYFSGVTAHFEIGSQRDAVRMTLDFTGDESIEQYLHSRTLSCPAFVPICYHLESSTSAIVVGAFGGQSETITGQWMGRTITETVHIGSSVAFQNIPFKYVTSSLPSGPKNLEVGGLISLNRESEFVRDSVLRLTPHPNGFDIQKQDSHEPAPGSVFPLIPGRRDWAFQSSYVFVGNSQVETSDGIIVLNPAISDLVIPISLKDAFLDAWREVEAAVETETGTEYILASCDSVISITIGDIRISRSRLLHPRALNWRRTSGNGGFLCHYNVRFSADDDSITVGRQLISSAGEIVVDLHNQVIQTVPSVTTQVPSEDEVLLSPKPLVPVYRHPRAERNTASGIITISVSEFTGSVDHSIASGFLVVSTRPIVMEGSYIWTFLRTEERGHIQCSAVSIGPEDERYVPTEGSIVFRRTPMTGRGLSLVLRRDPNITAQRYRAYLSQSSNKVRLILSRERPVIPANSIMIPPPEVITNTESPGKCAICLDEYVEGDSVQGLYGCCHTYHRDCVMPWLQGRQLTCPECRDHVTLRPTSSS